MHYLDINSKIMFGFLNKISAIAPVGINSSYPWESDNEQSHKGICGFGIVNIGRGCRGLQDIAVLVSYNIALHAFNLLVAVNALLGAGQRGTGTLTVNGTDGRVGRLASFKPDFLHKSVLKFGKRNPWHPSV